MEKRRYVGAIPGITAKAEYQGAWLSRRGHRRNVESVKSVAVGRCEADADCPAWKRPRWTHGVRGKDELSLE
jgi:hypothetical protein